MKILNKVINKHTDCHLKVDDTLLKITIRGLLIKTLKAQRSKNEVEFFLLSSGVCNY